MKNEHPEKMLKWLQSKPTLTELGTEFPDIRETVQSEIAEIIAGGLADGLPAYLKRMTLEEQLLKKEFYCRRGDKRIATKLAKQLLRSRIAHLTIKQHLISEATGIEKGKIRFNLFNGYVAQKLLFSDDLERKPVSLFWFNLVWPLLWQRRLLMPLVQPKGIYCFYSRELVDSLAALIGRRSCLEIAAGDGTLTRFLAYRGVNITATDDKSWGHEVNYPDFVVKQDAGDAIREYAPEVVLCSWPPADNTFERQVFRAGKVQQYIVISSRHHFAAGNWDEYRQQSSFDLEEDKKLSRLVLPPELDAAVYVFQRK